MCLIPEELCREIAAREQLLILQREKEDSGGTASLGKKKSRTEKQKCGPVEVRKNKQECQGWTSKDGKNVSI